MFANALVNIHQKYYFPVLQNKDFLLATLKYDQQANNVIGNKENCLKIIALNKSLFITNFVKRYVINLQDLIMPFFTRSKMMTSLYITLSYHKS